MRERGVNPDLLDPRGHLETPMDQKRVRLESLVLGANLEKMVPLASLALREPKATGVFLG